MEKMRANHFVLLVLFLCLARICTPNPPFLKKHFVLVHGAGHGAWCWYKIAPLLTSAGHNVTALDMSASGVDPRQVQQIHSVSDYTEPLIKFMNSLPQNDRVILVGHSFGGLPISVAMERFPRKIFAAVFATAVMPGPALNLSTINEEFSRNTNFMDAQFRFDEGSDKPPTSVLFGPKFWASTSYQLSPPEDLTLALTLVRFSPLFQEDLVLTKENYGSVRRIFIICGQDQSVQLLMINKNPPDEVRLIDGSDHMVMFSKPLDLFSNLHQISQSTL